MNAPIRFDEASDDALVDACLGGNQGAWTALVARYKNLVYSVPVRYRLSPDDAADIFQQVWLALFSELPNLRQAGALRAWLLTVAAHKCCRLKRRHLPVEQTTEIQLELLGTEFPPAWQKCAEQEQTVREAISKVPSRCRALVRMLFYDDPPVPYAEAASRLGLARGSIGFIRGRCLDKLREQLLKTGF